MMNRPENYRPGDYPLPQGTMLVPVPANAAMPNPFVHAGQVFPYQAGFEPADNGEISFDLYRYLRIATKYRWLIATITGSALMLGVVITFLMTPVYRATSTIQIDREAMNVVKIEGMDQVETGVGASEFYQTQYALLASRSLAERVASTLGLSRDKDFNVRQQKLTDIIKSYILGDDAPEADTGKAAGEDARRTVDQLTRMLTVSPVRNSRIVNINVDHPDPVVAQHVANGFAEVFIADNLDRRFEATSYARKFLEERLQQLKQKLEESEKQLVKYAEDKGIINLGDNRSLSSSDLEAVNTKLTEVRSERIRKELLWKQAQETSGLGLKQILDSAAIQENRKLRSQLAAEYQQKLAIYKPAFPDMIQLRNQIRELDNAMETEVAAVKQSIEAEYLAAAQEEEELTARLAATKAHVVDQRNRSIQYTIIQREVDTNRTLYDGLLQRYKEIGVAGGVGTNNVSIVDRASQPRAPRSPWLALNLALALAAGLALSAVLALVLDYLDDSFKSPEDIEQEIAVPVIGIVPKPSAGLAIEEELADQRSGMSEAYRSLRTGLQFSTSDGLPSTILFTSSKPSEGKTTTTISLARSLAQIGLNVLLVDGDLRNASVHKRLHCSNEFGLSNVLSGARTPEEVVQETDTKGLLVITSGPLPPNPAELLTGPKLQALLTLAAESFDIVLIDGPPVMGLADAPILSTTVQSTVLVIAANETRRSTVKIALRRLRMARANIIGTLLNKFDSKQTGYGYGYGYGDYEYHSYGVKELPLREAA